MRKLSIVCADSRPRCRIWRRGGSGGNTAGGDVCCVFARASRVAARFNWQSVSQVRKMAPGAETRQERAQCGGGGRADASFSAVLLKEINAGIKGVPACQRRNDCIRSETVAAPEGSAGCGRTVRRVLGVWVGLVTPRVSGSTFRRRKLEVQASVRNLSRSLESSRFLLAAGALLCLCMRLRFMVCRLRKPHYAALAQCYRGSFRLDIRSFALGCICLLTGYLQCAFSSTSSSQSNYFVHVLAKKKA